ncbi:unnamed protein product [Rotaria magnacalcarata]|uniref:Uncharacterized protein n=1 Tax=Rotaria magnacalcarata TaxID=392030 RepID=A0A816NIN2_9BILA|nr:unnamed protein product [Rotaria magnacalcarata]
MTLFPFNSLSSFNVKLNKPLYLEGDYEVGLEEIHIDSKALNISNEDSEIVIKRFLIPDSELPDDVLESRETSLLLHRGSIEASIIIERGEYQLDNLITKINEKMSQDSSISNLQFVLSNQGTLLGLYSFFKKNNKAIRWQTLKISSHLRRYLTFRYTEVPLKYIFDKPFKNRYIDIGEKGEYITFRGVEKNSHETGHIKQLPIYRKMKITPGDYSIETLIDSINTFLLDDDTTSVLRFNYKNNILSLMLHSKQNDNTTWLNIECTSYMQNIFGLTEKNVPLEYFYKITLPDKPFKIPADEVIIFKGLTDEPIKKPEENIEARRFTFNEKNYNIQTFIETLNIKLSQDFNTKHLICTYNGNEISLTTLKDKLPETINWETVKVSENIQKILNLKKKEIPIINLNKHIIQPTQNIDIKTNDFFAIIGIKPPIMKPVEASFTLAPGKYSKSYLIASWNKALRSNDETKHLNFQVINGKLMLETITEAFDNAPDWNSVKVTSEIKEILNLKSNIMTYNEFYNIPFSDSTFTVKTEQVLSIIGQGIENKTTKRKKLNIIGGVFRGGLQDDPFSEIRIKIEPKLYHTLDKLISVINNRLKEKKTTDDLQFVLTKGKTVLGLNRSQNFNRLWLKTFFKFTPNLSYVLGLPDHNEFINANTINNLNVHNDISLKVPRMIFIYSNIAVHSLVGDTTARLLKTMKINLEGESNNIDVSEIFPRVRYVDVDQAFIDTIRIDIRTTDGVPFPFDDGDLLCVLHIRRKKI